jgi:hypothetical protein
MDKVFKIGLLAVVAGLVLVIYDHFTSWSDVSASQASTLALVWERDGLRCQVFDGQNQIYQVKRIACEVYIFE